MFTGIIEEVGEIRSIEKGAASCVLTVKAKKVLEGTQIGDSIALNGVCLTVTSISDGCYKADVMSETMRRSSLGSIRVGTPVNLERAMRLDGRFGGHIVSGHIDGTGTIQSIRRDENAVWYTVAADAAQLRYIVEKGSVALDGISLTVATVDERCFSVSIIPHTQGQTNLYTKKIGSIINIECDIIGKYVEKLMQPTAGRAAPNKELTAEFFIENGF